MIYVSFFLVATVLPVIASHFDALGEIEWVGTAYILPMTALQLLFGKARLYARPFYLAY